MVKVGGQAPVLVQLPATTQRGADRLEIARGLRFRVVLDLVDACAQVELECVPLLAGHAEQAERAGAGPGNEGFFADRFEGGGAALQARRGLPAVAESEGGFHAAFVGLFVECGADFFALELDVVVVGVAEAVAQAAAFAPGIGQRAFQVVAVLAHAQPDPALARGEVTGFAGVAVIVLETRRRNTDEAPVAQQRTADRSGVGVDERIGLAAIRRVVVLGVSVHRVGMQREAIVAAVDAGHDGIAVAVAGIEARFGTAAEAIGDRRFGDASVDDVDYAADRAAAVEQGGGTLQHFDLVGQERFHRRRVVLADRGDVLGGQPIAEYGHARAIQAPQDRAPDAWTEVGALHARQAGDGFAQAGGAILVQAFAGQYLGRLAQGIGGIAQGAGGDDDAVQVLYMAILGVRIGVAGIGGR